ncbi:MAG: T9SS type A sorting domain-containing protein [Saprospiraceae bacterium]|nr:T9SS type A sorting domain-containing protein [Saprospiraceae bacterium]
MRVLVAMYFSFGALFLGSQDLERFTFDIAGGVAHTDQYQVHYSLGQSFVRTVNLGTIIVSDGFIQGHIQEMSTTVSSKYIDNDFLVYPNPTINNIHVQTKSKVARSRIGLYDQRGLLLWTLQFDQDLELDLTSLLHGTYFIRWLSHNDELIKLCKVLKM